MIKRVYSLATLLLTLVVAGIVFSADPLFNPALNYEVGSGPRAVFSADLDGDNDNDLAVANRVSGGVSVLLNNSIGIFTTES